MCFLQPVHVSLLLRPKKAVRMMRVVSLTSVLWGVRRVMMKLCGRWRSTTSNFFLHQQTKPFACGILHPSAVSGYASLLAQPPSGPAAPVCLRIGCIMIAFLAQFHPALHLCILSRTYMCLRSWCALSQYECTSYVMRALKNVCYLLL